jgi:DNA-binding IclR family transcriptional regulator
LSALPWQELDAFMADGELVPLTPYTITDKAVFRAELERVRRDGFALDEREFRTDIACVAVPVQDNSGRTVASMSITERPETMVRRRNELREALTEAAAAFSRKAFPAPVSLQPAEP